MEWWPKVLILILLLCCGERLADDVQEHQWADKWMVMTFQWIQVILDLYQLLKQEANSWADALFGLCTMSGHLWTLQALLGCLVPWGNLASLGWVPSDHTTDPTVILQSQFLIVILTTSQLKQISQMIYVIDVIFFKDKQEVDLTWIGIVLTKPRASLVAQIRIRETGFWPLGQEDP